jgi:hypothetical protein
MKVRAKLLKELSKTMISAVYVSVRWKMCYAVPDSSTETGIKEANYINGCHWPYAASLSHSTGQYIYTAYHRIICC